jgi:hypothetical protein
MDGHFSPYTWRNVDLIEIKYGLMGITLTFIVQHVNWLHGVWVLLEKPSVAQLLKNFPIFYGTRRFSTMFTRTFHWSLSKARSVQSKAHHPISLKIHSSITWDIRKIVCDCEQWVIEHAGLSGKVSDLYSEGDWFQSRLEHWVSCFRGFPLSLKIRKSFDAFMAVIVQILVLCIDL